MSGDKFDTYDFLINDEDEAMLLLYVRDSAPDKPVIEIDAEDRSAILIRNSEDEVGLSDIPEEVLDAMQDSDKLLVCELSIEDNEEETKIVYAYEAEITD